MGQQLVNYFCFKLHLDVKASFHAEILPDISNHVLIHFNLPCFEKSVLRLAD